MIRSFKSLVEQFTVAVNVAFNQNWKEFSPKFANILYTFNAGLVSEVNFPFWGFIGGPQKFDGKRKHRRFPLADNYKIKHETYDNSVDIGVPEFERASASQNPLSSLDVYRTRIADMAKDAKEHPVVIAFDMIEAGETNEFGTAFDGENFFSTDHTYLETTNFQSNLLTGTGITVAQLEADILSVLKQFNGFEYTQAGSSTPRKFNGLTTANLMLEKILFVVPNELLDIFHKVQKGQIISNPTGNAGISNTIMNINFTTLPFADSNDWYALLLDKTTEKPLINPMEKVPVMDSPNPDSESIRENDYMTWGTRGRYAVGYGVWWKAVKVTNT